MATYLICDDGVEYIFRGRVDCASDLRQFSESELIAVLKSQGVIEETAGAGLDPVALDRLAAAIEQFNSTMDTLFTFDPELFGIVLTGCMVLFSVGWGIGVVMRLLAKNRN